MKDGESLDVKSIPFTDGPGEPERNLRVGDTMYDTLTGREVRVFRITQSPGCTPGVWTDSDHMEGGRHPWEITFPIRRHRFGWFFGVVPSRVDE